MTILKTPRLRLRLFEESDAPFILKHVNEPSFIENIRDSGVRTLEDARRYLVDGPLASYREHGFGLWLMELLETGEPIGMCGLLKRPTLDHPDLGFALDPPHWGRGYAREAAEATLEYGFGELGMTRILAITSLTNVRSMGLLRRLGMVDEGVVEMNGGESRLFWKDSKA